MRWNPVAPLLALARERAAAWMRRRQGADLLPVALERRRLYILPTGTGVAFAALLFLMLIAGLNYGNSLALFLTFLLGAFALVAMRSEERRVGKCRSRGSPNHDRKTSICENCSVTNHTILILTSYY